MRQPTFIYDMMIADSDGNELPVHETGRVAVRMRLKVFMEFYVIYW
jgi:hypothetical protein